MKRRDLLLSAVTALVALAGWPAKTFSAWRNLKGGYDREFFLRFWTGERTVSGPTDCEEVRFRTYRGRNRRKPLLIGHYQGQSRPGRCEGDWLVFSWPGMTVECRMVDEDTLHVNSILFCDPADQSRIENMLFAGPQLAFHQGCDFDVEVMDPIIGCKAPTTSPFGMDWIC